jgi:hypothetical protein
MGSTFGNGGDLFNYYNFSGKEIERNYE